MKDSFQTEIPEIVNLKTGAFSLFIYLFIVYLLEFPIFSLGLVRQCMCGFEAKRYRACILGRAVELYR